jgi:hypothetical protein
MSVANPLWGAPRIHGELLKLVIDVGQTTVAKYMAKRRRPPSQGWRTFLHNHADAITSMDLFVVPTILFRLSYGLLILASMAGCDRTSERRMDRLPTDRSLRLERGAAIISFAIGTARTAKPSSGGSEQWAYETDRSRHNRHGKKGCPERLIGSIRWDCLDHVVVFGEQHLRHLLSSYQKYYNELRTHLSLTKDAPIPRDVQRAGRVLPLPILGGLHHEYVRV